MIAVAPAGDGAAIGDILIIGGIISAVTLAVLFTVLRYRAGGAAPVRFAGNLLEYVLRVPGWAALPAVLAIGAALLAYLGFIWDIGIHIDKGRDEGPFGTVAHYPGLVGLIGIYLAGILACGMAPTDRRHASRSAVDIRGVGPVPAGALLLLAGGGFALLGFPLDDLWHRVFGQDVTLWGPTHTMFFGGIISGTCGALILMMEGARARGREPFGSWYRRPLPVILGAVFLFVATHATDEFNWGLPQYRQLWQPLLLAGIGGFGLIVARSLGGRGGAAATLIVYLPLQFFEVFLIGALGTTRPASILFIAEAVIVEAIMWRRGGLKAGALAGLGVGTLGFAAEYAWTQIGQPIAWQPALLPEGLPTAALAGVAGGVLASLLAGALTDALPKRGLAVALTSAAVILGLAINAGISTEPKMSATMTLTNERTEVTTGGKATKVADLSVRLSDPSLAKDANWAYVLGWQGGSRYEARLERRGDGTLTSTQPVPIGGTWKSFVRVHNGRDLVASAIRMPADPALGFKGFPAEPQVTRPMLRDTKLLQIERKDDGPLWAWKPAMLLVMSLNLMLMACIGVAAVRAGRGLRCEPVGVEVEARALQGDLERGRGPERHVSV